MMDLTEFSMALTQQQRRRASTNAHNHSVRDDEIQKATSELHVSTGSLIIGRQCFSSRKSTGFDNDVDDAHVPLAIKYLEQVTLELFMTKKHTDVRYLMLVRHHDLNVMWHRARTFDEYRKLRQRLLKKLQHGHFCNANCPWLYSFLKSYFPKKRVFTFSSTRMIELRKQTLERFFAALYKFLTDRKNFGCSIIMNVFADEVVDFIYCDGLRQHGLTNFLQSPFEPTELRLSESFTFKSDVLESSQKLQLIQQDSDRKLRTQLSLTSSLEESTIDDVIVNNDHCDICTICGLTLSDVAEGESGLSTAVVNDRNRLGNSNRMPCNSGPGSVKAHGSGNTARRSHRRDNARRRRAVAYYLTTLSCGHQFHDECIVPKLNESLKCPTCGRIPSND